MKVIISCWLGSHLPPHLPPPFSSPDLLVNPAHHLQFMRGQAPFFSMSQQTILQWCKC
eukprot:CAMPEP_0179142820 /NCGR_PEP_ID=MMETSP0796-20121207/68630_1 /TAXON_ID=73915 /ORGANISM="Pyrodinium bahamense, Strain pbaha01" /LENGTH=57 /DNA_ID=CAMNT_0020842749 /DNA_START=11 /DNA_END=184 /DNA_ORIENTATION=+